MKQNTSHTLPTETFAAANSVKGQSVRARLSVTGSYFGIKPTKLASGRLLWPNVQALANSGGSKKCAPTT